MEAQFWTCPNCGVDVYELPNRVDHNCPVCGWDGENYDPPEHDYLTLDESPGQFRDYPGLDADPVTDPVPIKRKRK